jgi:L-ascorbate metabolism protein UlaG (beta-lactamase superfamily)
MPDSLTFIGTATTLLRLGGFTLLTDPNFLHRGARVYLGYGLSSRRQTEPAMQPEDLPDLDAVVLSHLHGDHFDRVARDRLDRALPIVTTKEAARRLRRWGFGRATPLTRWETHELVRYGERLRVTAVPGIHGPGPVARLLPPVIGTVLELMHGDTAALTVYITGDTLCRPFLHEVTERFPALDAMMIHLGGTRIAGLLVTMDERQGGDLVAMLAPPVTIPIHYDDYTVFKTPLQRFVAEFNRRGLPGELRTVTRGQTIPLGSAHARR